MNTQPIKPGSLESLIAAARAAGDSALPVEKWAPSYCGEMDMLIRRDGSWWHEGTRITRAPLIKLFASVLRKDDDGETYLVTPVEKIKIEVEAAPFTGVRADIEGSGHGQRIFITTNMGDVTQISASKPLRVETDPHTLEPAPFALIRGRLEALLLRPVFYDLVNHSSEIQTENGPQLGLYSGGTFFPLGPAGIHNV